MTRPALESDEFWDRDLGDARKALFVSKMDDSDKLFGKMIAEITPYEPMPVFADDQGGKPIEWTEKPKTADADDFNTVLAFQRLWLSDLVLLDADIRPLSRLNHPRTEEIRREVAKRNERFLLAAVALSRKSKREHELQNGLRDYLIDFLDYVAWRQRPDSTLPDALMPLPDEFKSMFESLKKKEPQNADGSVHGNTIVNAQMRGELFGIVRMVLAFHLKEEPKFRKPDGSWNAEVIAKWIEDMATSLWPLMEDESARKLDKPLSSGKMAEHLSKWFSDGCFPPR